MSTARNSIRLAAVCAFVTFAPQVFAQNGRVVAANSSNNRILDVTFVPPSTTQLNDDANTRVSLQSVAFRDDGSAGLQLLVADRGGQVLFYDQSFGTGEIVLDAAVPGNPPLPDGLSLDPSQNLYGVSSGTGNATAKDARVWALLRDTGCPGPTGACLPGGYAGPVAYIDTSVEVLVDLGGVPTPVTADLLEETRVVASDSGLLGAGDLLVLSSSPAMLLRYRAADLLVFLDDLAAGLVPAELQPDVFIQPPNASVPVAQRFPVGSLPQGMDFTNAGNLLISAGEGIILNYQSDGTRLSNGMGGFLDFAGGLGNGKFKLATGSLDGEFWAFVADRNGGELLRFLVEDDGTGTLSGVVASLESPVGVATTTASTAFTPTGSNVTITTSNILTSTAENVLTAGTTGFTEFVFEDPRESEVSVPPGQPLHRSLLTDEVSAFLPPGIEIPPHVRAFRKGDPVTGPPTFVLVVVDSNAEVVGELSHVADESLVLGYSGDCEDPDPTQRPRLFWVPSPEEPQVPEGPVFINVTDGCGTSKGKTRYWSLFLAARDTRPLLEVFDAQFSGLGTALGAATCVDKKTRRFLLKEYNAAARAYGKGNLADTLDRLNNFVLVAEGSASGFASCTENEGGDLRARAKSSIFTLEEILF